MRSIPLPSCIVSFMWLIIFTSCALTQRPCNLASSFDCLRSQTRWQEAINAIVAANFPEDYGKYQAVIWEKPFDNAWVTKGREVNITLQFVSKLGRAHLYCVAAHELAHLKMGHYYSKIGIIITNQKTFGSSSKIETHLTHHYGISKDFTIPEGFGKNQEKEADRLALKFIHRLGLTSPIYLQLLNGFLKNDSHAKLDSSMENRIRFLRSQEHLLIPTPLTTPRN